MTTPINPSLVPTIPPGGLFTALTTDNTIQIRWLIAADPVFYGALNRPLADIAIRQLILAKAIDQLEVALGHQAVFPFIIQPRIPSGSGLVDVPLDLIWDLNISMPTAWTDLRLAKIKRIAGNNQATGFGSEGGGSFLFTGKLRFVFTATEGVGNVETAVLQADLTIDSQLTYQRAPLVIVPSAEEAVVLPPSASQTFAGYVIFKTPDTTQLQNQNFLLAVPPPINPVVTNGVFTPPAIYELADSIPGDAAGTFDAVPVKHGTGMLDNSAWSPIPPLNSDIQTWIEATNYPFDAIANLTSTIGLAIPVGLFREFNITAPAGDQPTGDTSGLTYPVWVNRIERVSSQTGVIRWYFSTLNVTDTNPSLTPVEFATMDLAPNMTPNEIVEIVPLNNLLLRSGSDAALWTQHFGRGHVVLSELWGISSANVISDFFNAFLGLIDNPPDATFPQTSTRLGAFGISRVPKYTPTEGQSQALVGSTERLSIPIGPSDSNRCVLEQDQGVGNQIDLEAQPGITPNVAVQRFGQMGGLCHRCVSLIVDSTQVTGDPDTFYTTVILPRLTVLLGRSPQFADLWFQGTRVLFFNGSTWQSLG